MLQFLHVQAISGEKISHCMTVVMKSSEIALFISPLQFTVYFPVQYAHELLGTVSKFSLLTLYSIISLSFMMKICVAHGL